MKFLSLVSVLLVAFSCNPKANQTEEKSLEKSKQQVVSVKPTPFAELPKICDESSGLEYLQGTIYTMNDSGGEDELYVMNKKGELQRNLKLKDAKNHDWEDVAYGGGYFYVGDFGNNLGNRDNLTIYQLTEMKGEKADTRTIEFEYGNQTDFTVKNRKNSFDCESMLAFKDELVLFSKDWVNFNTRVYHLPINTDEKQTLQPAEEMAIGALITGADYDAKTQTLILCGYYDYHNSIWIFRNSTPEKFLTDDYTKVELSGLYDAQLEGITFLDENTALFSTEKTKTFDQQLWTVDISQY